MIDDTKVKHASTRWVEGPDGLTLDARVDVGERTVVLHSRGGATGGRAPRNTQYELALHEICRRGKASGAFVRILIDSGPARKLPEDDRVLLIESEIAELKVSELVTTVRSRLRSFGQVDGTTGGNSTKRVRFDLKYDTAAQLLRLRLNPPAAFTLPLLTLEQLHKVTIDGIKHAISQILSSEERMHVESDGKFYLLTHDGERVSPDQVFKLALEAALGEEIQTYQFDCGWGTPCFDLLEAAGYSIVTKNGDDRREFGAIIGEIDDETRDFIEGSTARATHLKRERNRALVAAFKSAFLRQHKRFFCQLCGEDWIGTYGAVIASGCFEAHHAAVPVSEMPDYHQSTIHDLKLLCANCHRAEHRRMKIGFIR